MSRPCRAVHREANPGRAARVIAAPTQGESGANGLVIVTPVSP